MKALQVGKEIVRFTCLVFSVSFIIVFIIVFSRWAIFTYFTKAHNSNGSVRPIEGDFYANVLKDIIIILIIISLLFSIVEIIKYLLKKKQRSR